MASGPNHDQNMKPGLTRGRRASSRLRVRLAAQITTRTQTQRAVLVDLSVSGACLVLRGDLVPGREAVLEWGQFEAFGEIVWRRSDRCGLTFFEPLAPTVIFATRDLDEVAHLPQDRELVRQVAQGWVEGRTRL